MNYYRKSMDVLSKGISILVAGVLVFMAILMFIEVIRRYLFSTQFIWSEELIRYLAVWIAFVGGAAAFKEASLVCFDLISSRATGRKKIILNLIINTIVLIFMVFIFRLGLMNIMSPSVYKKISVGIKISMAIPYAAIPVGTALMIVFALDNYVSLITKLKKVYGGD